MKENYWRQNELENEEFQRQRENERDLRLKEEQQQLHEEDTQKSGRRRRKIWQRLSRKKTQQQQQQQRADDDLDVKNNNENDDNNSKSNQQKHVVLHQQTRGGLNVDHVGYRQSETGDNCAATSGPDDDNKVDDDDENNINFVIDGDKQREEEILQILSEQQKRLFSATATATASMAAGEKQQVKRQRQPAKRDENELNLSFCGCGFLGIYHVGVASCFHEYAPQLSIHKISGSSAGALVAVAHICGNLQLAYATTDILRVAIEARARTLGPFHPSFDINAIVREALEKGLPDDVHLRANGKLHVSLTRVYDGENVIISEYNSKEDVIQVLLCSCFIPFWSGLVAPKYKGVTYIDGGFSNNLLTLDDKTVRVSPFSGEADICPQDDTFNLLQVSLSNTSFSLTPNNLYRLSHALLPPPPEILSDLCEQGFADAFRFLQRMKLISCVKCLEIRSSLLVPTNSEDIDEAFTSELGDAVGGVSSSINRNSDDSVGWKRFGTNSGRSSTASVSAAIQDPSSVTHLDEPQRHQRNIISEHQERNANKNDQTETANLRRDSSQMLFEQQQQQQHNSTSKQHQLDSSSSSTLARPRQRFPSSWHHNVNNIEDATDDLPSSAELEDNTSLASCNECVQMRQRGLNQAMPKQFSDRIRDACDTVNKSLSNWIYSHRPIKYLSYLAAPYFLPIDISLALVYKCWRRLPFIRSELINCIQEVVSFLVGIMKRMLAHATSTFLVESSLDWESSAIEYEKEIINRKSSRAGSTAGTHSVQGEPSLCEKTKGTNSLSSSSSRTSIVSTSSTTNASHFSLRITTDGVSLSKQSRRYTSTADFKSCSTHDVYDTIVTSPELLKPTVLVNFIS